MGEYADRDHMELDRDGNYYIRHVAAMTKEGLHAKSDIAAELAWRDREIDRLKGTHPQPVTPAGGEVNAEAVAVVRRRDGETIIDWLIEGGDSDLDGAWLCVTDQPLPEDGAVTWFTHPPVADAALVDAAFESAAAEVVPKWDIPETVIRCILAEFHERYVAALNQRGGGDHG
jgi:hypothetical protein